ncbi:YheC/D like ATP-grasp [Alteribacillus bidgolensis]|uniref:YheC/D like ATP-grasp n=1 Tax=Alteribacillus bidgolensis TaxID=930129 RepID=A0A1G8D6P9_9BACI|nr:YheC/D like ATP-grasp [Alteribacillus bidgolensis]
MVVKLKGRNKYKMYFALKKDEALQKHLPATLKWNRQNFINMLKKYNSVVVKPRSGRQGQRIYFVSKINSKYLVHINKTRKYFKRRTAAYNYIKKSAEKRKYIIQQEIDLATIDGKRFDFRIIVQRLTTKDDWVVNGIIARKAGAGYKVTNKRRRGIVLPLETAMEKLNAVEKKDFIVEEIKKIALAAAETLGRSFPNQKIFGVDIGMKEDGSLYIFELNRWPLIQGFKSLKDKTQYNKIRKYKRKAKK